MTLDELIASQGKGGAIQGNPGGDDEGTAPQTLDELIASKQPGKPAIGAFTAFSHGARDLVSRASEVASAAAPGLLTAAISGAAAEGLTPESSASPEEIAKTPLVQGAQDWAESQIENERGFRASLAAEEAQGHMGLGARMAKAAAMPAMALVPGAGAAILGLGGAQAVAEKVGEHPEATPGQQTQMGAVELGKQALTMATPLKIGAKIAEAMKVASPLLKAGMKAAGAAAAQPVVAGIAETAGKAATPEVYQTPEEQAKEWYAPMKEAMTPENLVQGAIFGLAARGGKPKETSPIPDDFIHGMEKTNDGRFITPSGDRITQQQWMDNKGQREAWMKGKEVTPDEEIEAAPAPHEEESPELQSMRKMAEGATSERVKKAAQDYIAKAEKRQQLQGESEELEAAHTEAVAQGHPIAGELGKQRQALAKEMADLDEQLGGGKKPTTAGMQVEEGEPAEEKPVAVGTKGIKVDTANPSDFVDAVHAARGGRLEPAAEADEQTWHDWYKAEGLDEQGATNAAAVRHYIEMNGEAAFNQLSRLYPEDNDFYQALHRSNWGVERGNETAGAGGGAEHAGERIQEVPSGRAEGERGEAAPREAGDTNAARDESGRGLSGQRSVNAEPAQQPVQQPGAERGGEAGRGPGPAPAESRAGTEGATARSAARQSLVSQAYEELVNDFGRPTVEGLVKRGWIRGLMGSEASHPTAADRADVRGASYSGRGGKHAELYLNRIPEGAAPAVARHELMHEIPRRYLGESSYLRMLKDLARNRADPDIGMAWDRVKSKKGYSHLEEGSAGFMHEVAGHMVEEGDKSGFVRRLINDFRVWIRKNVSANLAGKMDAGQLHALLRQAMRAGAEGKVGQEPLGHVTSYSRGEIEPAMEGLPRKVVVDGKEEDFGPIPHAREAARDYMEKAGLPYNPPTKYEKTNVQRAKQIAKAFDEMKHDPQDPEVKSAYDKMIKETEGQYEAMLRAGMKVEFMPDGRDPYDNPRKAIMDVRDNKHLYIYSTRSGFGKGAEMDTANNPLLAETKHKISGQTALANDLFRAVHDYFGHAKEGVGFRSDGEENAWRSHASMYSPEARRAMTTETRGQNSWLNWGPYGEQNRTAKTADTVFADQKTGLLPKWMSEEGSGQASQKRISSNVVLGKKPAENLPETTELRTAERNPTLVEKYARKFEQYPDMPARGENESAKDYLGRVVEHMKKNILAVWDRVSDATREKTKEWYRGANRLTREMADESGYSHQQVAGVTATISPSTDWDMNVEGTRRILDIVNHHADDKWTPEMESHANSYWRGGAGKRAVVEGTKLSEPEKAKVATWSEDQANRLMLDSIRGKTLNQAIAQAPDRAKPLVGAAWLRSYSNAHGDRTFRRVNPDGTFGDVATTNKGEPYGYIEQSMGPLTRAMAILRGEDINSTIGKGHKVRNFYNNIIDPEHTGHVTIDTHAVNVAHLRPMGQLEPEVVANFGGTGGAKDINLGLKGHYPVYAEAYRQAAQEAGVMPREMQSVTWEAIRKLFGGEPNNPDEELRGTDLKTEQHRNAINRMWEDMQNGKTELGETQQRVFEYAGERGNGVEGSGTGGDEGLEHPGDTGGLQDGGERGFGSVIRGDGELAGGDEPNFAIHDPVFSKRWWTGGDNEEQFGKDLDTSAPGARAALEATGGINVRETLGQRAARWRATAAQNAVKWLFDDLNAIKDWSPRGYMLARMTRGSGQSGIEGIMDYGLPHIDAQGLNVKADPRGGFAQQVLKPLGNESQRFFWWVASQRAGNLKRLGLENLFGAQHIQVMSRLNQGVMDDGRNRGQVYAQAQKDLTKFNNSMLEVAKDSGLIDDATAQLFKDNPYVPFFRAMQADEKFGGGGNSLGSQKAWDKLKGGTSKLNEDLLQNVLQNWNHLFSASAKNRAALQVAKDAEAAMAASQVPAGTKGNIMTVKDGGVAKHYEIHDDPLFEAVTALDYQPGSIMKYLTAPRTFFTAATVANPFFKVRTLIRESMAALAQSKDISMNPIKNVAQGLAGTKKGSQSMASTVAGGAQMLFGHTNYADNFGGASDKLAKQYGQQAVNNTGDRLAHLMRAGMDIYRAFGNRLENVNRVALYEQARAKGYDHLESSFIARDLLDFSMKGGAPLVRFFTSTVPFMNARLQAMYSLARTAKADPARVATVVGAVTAASLGLMLTQKDDQDWKDRPDWDRDSYYYLKVGSTAFRVPKPFELGAIGTLAERTWEAAMPESLGGNQEMTGERWQHNFGYALLQSLALDPTPQAIKPMFGVWANRDPGTGKPIVPQQMANLRPEDIVNERTSGLARALGGVVPNPVTLMQGHPEALNPMQIDYLIKGYSSWLGATGMWFADRATHSLQGRNEAPAMTAKDMTSSFVENLPATTPSHYVEAAYDQAHKVEQAMASMKFYQTHHDVKGIADVRSENAEDLAKGPQTTNVLRQMGAINKQIKDVEAGPLVADEKSKRLAELNAARNRIAESYMYSTNRWHR